MPADALVCIHGDETFLSGRALAELEAEVLAGADPSLSREVFEAPAAEAAQVLAAARTLPFLGGRKLVVVKGCDRWPAAEWKVLLPYLQAPSPSTCLVLMAAQLDGRLGAVKTLKQQARWVECRKPAERELPGWVQRMARDAGLRLDNRVLGQLAGRVDADLQLLSREIEKLRVFAGPDGRVTQEDVEALVGETRATSVFAFCDALGARDLRGAVRGLGRLLQLGEAPLKVLFMIVRHFRHLWAARELGERERRVDGRAAARALGVQPFVAEKALQQARGWTQPQLREAFGRFLAADLALKSGGGREVLERLVLELCGGQTQTRPDRGRGARGGRC